MDILRLDGAVKKRGNHFTLGPVDLRLAPGEILGVAGPGGAGKTTLLRLLWGFLRPDAGHVSVFGRTPHLEQVWVRTRAGYSGAPADLHGWMTGTGYLEFTAGFYPSWDWERARQLSRAFGLRLDRKVGALSRHDRAKLSLVAALTHRPLLLLLDEPVSGMARSARSEMLGLVRRIATEHQTCVVLSSRAPEHLAPIADGLLTLHRGRVIAHASAAPDRAARAKFREVTCVPKGDRTGGESRQPASERGADRWAGHTTGGPGVAGDRP